MKEKKQVLHRLAPRQIFRQTLRSLLGILLRPLRNRRSRMTAERALTYSLSDLHIPWPIEIVWDRELSCLGQVSGNHPHQIWLREEQGRDEVVRTVFHEAYHIAQFHRWKDLEPLSRKNSPGDMARAEALAELYAQVTYRTLKNQTREECSHGFLGKLFQRGLLQPALRIPEPPT